MSENKKNIRKEDEEKEKEKEKEAEREAEKAADRFRQKQKEDTELTDFIKEKAGNLLKYLEEVFDPSIKQTNIYALMLGCSQGIKHDELYKMIHPYLHGNPDDLLIRLAEYNKLHMETWTEDVTDKLSKYIAMFISILS